MEAKLAALWFKMLIGGKLDRHQSHSQVESAVENSLETCVDHTFQLRTICEELKVNKRENLHRLQGSLTGSLLLQLLPLQYNLLQGRHRKGGGGDVSEP